MFGYQLNLLSFSLSSLHQGGAVYYSDQTIKNATRNYGKSTSIMVLYRKKMKVYLYSIPLSSPQFQYDVTGKKVNHSL